MGWFLGQKDSAFPFFFGFLSRWFFVLNVTIVIASYFCGTLLYKTCRSCGTSSDKFWTSQSYGIWSCGICMSYEICKICFSFLSRFFYNFLWKFIYCSSVAGIFLLLVSFITFSVGRKYITILWNKSFNVGKHIMYYLQVQHTNLLCLECALRFFIWKSKLTQ